MPLQRLYFISGLGANEKAFDKIGDLGVEKIMIAWMPNEEEETIIHYSKRIIQQYGITKEDTIVGLSFGGLVAQQIAEILDMRMVILISSFRTYHDFQNPLKFGMQAKLFKLIPKINIPIISQIVANYLNSGSEYTQPVLIEMIKTTDMTLMKWSLDRIYEQAIPIGKHLKKYNIIGDEDRIISYWENDWTVKINHGSHFMVYDKGKEITSVISNILDLEQV